MVSPVPPDATNTTTKKRAAATETKKKAKASQQPPKDEPTTEKKTDDNESNELSAEDIAFEKLLNSQRDILAKLDFGNASNSSELQFVEGPDNLPLVSPHSSASEFHLSYEFEYDYHCQQQQQEQFEFEQQQQAYLCNQVGYPSARHHQGGYPYNRQHQTPAPYAPQQRYHRHRHDQYDAGADALPPSTGGGSCFPRDSTHSVGVGDDRFILDQIQIGRSGSSDAIKGPAVFDADNENVRRRKRETEQELMDTFHGTSSSSHHYRRTSNKKRRSGASSHNTATAYDDLLPVPSDLNDMDDDNASTASLLLDDLDFPSMHDTTTSTTSEDTQMKTSTTTAKTKEVVTTTPVAVVKPVVSMDGDEVASVAATTTTTRRSSRNLWKPRQRRSSTTSTTEGAGLLSIEAQRSMWKPRRSSTASMNDSSASLQVPGDLTATTQEEYKNGVALQKKPKATGEVVEV